MHKIEGIEICAKQDVPAFHKISLEDIYKGETVYKYGYPIGKAVCDISAGGHVHVHNLISGLTDIEEYAPCFSGIIKLENTAAHDTFSGYVREDNSVGVRNEIWVINTVGCINSTTEAITKAANEKFPKQSFCCFPHAYGCSQMGEDFKNTQKILTGMIRHPNAAGVLVLGLGCENNNIHELKKMLGDVNPDRVKFLEIQKVINEYDAAMGMLADLVNYASHYKRRSCPVRKLKVGLKCGGSDAFSGITANPLVGLFSDYLIQKGGTTILTEIPEMFGAESILLGRCKDKDVFDQLISLINQYKKYYIEHGQPIFANPSPGNKEGGITTLEEKSLGCVQKGGAGTITDVLQYGEAACKSGLNILSSPGNDAVSSSALMAAGAHIVLFTTGRGTPFGTGVPTIKISTNSNLYRKKQHWIDYNAGLVIDKGLERVKEDFISFVIKVANGEIDTKNELNEFKEIAIFKKDITL